MTQRANIKGRKGQLAPEEFGTAAAAIPRIQAASLEIAKRVLVDGIPQAEAAREAGLSKQRVSRIVNDVLAVANSVPRGWELVQVWLPSEVANPVRVLARNLRLSKENAVEQ
ncbi:TrfB-related DNA-binding protein [Achromobacter ruhlandii]|uniref:TrfB-related DNA-binding protein n=1 Tax=Achromobacter ruhlandii TaxID=72557 RepID=UPI003BA06BC7